MPEMRFRILWPDGVAETCYSPSLVVKEHLRVGASYEPSEFLARCRVALNIASNRVKEKYGHACSLALGQLARIEEGCAKFASRPDARVSVEAFEE
jgi:uncharacterized repeat protein (TIGR04042 family)